MIHIVVTENGIFAVYIDDYEAGKKAADAVKGILIELPGIVYDAREIITPKGD